MEERITVYIDADLEDLIPEFLENRREDVETIRAALGREDFDLIGRLGHSMKGAGGGYGFDAITDIGRVIEEAAKTYKSEEITTAVASLSLYLDRVDIVYEEAE
ncbi:MAG: Hpt domain-containing protein [candidate division Zixibacteria bacterium]|nr:Hpt domain-containing protein [candidate division Zixibacteria bacterium]